MYGLWRSGHLAAYIIFLSSWDNFSHYVFGTHKLVVGNWRCDFYQAKQHSSETNSHLQYIHVLDLNASLWEKKEAFSWAFSHWKSSHQATAWWRQLCSRHPVICLLSCILVRHQHRLHCAPTSCSLRPVYLQLLARIKMYTLRVLSLLAIWHTEGHGIRAAGLEFSIDENCVPSWIHWKEQLS